MEDLEKDSERFVPKSRQWPFILLASSVLCTLGFIGAWHGGRHYWLAISMLGLFLPGIPVAILQMIKPKPRSRSRNGFIVSRSPWTAICYLFVASSWLLTSLFFGSHLPAAQPIAIIFVLLSSVGVVIGLWQFFDQRPLIRINEQGYYDRSLHSETIPWSQVVGAEIKNLDGCDFISIKLKDPTLVQRSPSILAQAHRKLESLVGAELYQLGFVQLDAQYIDEALDYILARCASQEEHGDFEALLKLAGQPEATT